jgi:hypothetical protein
MTTASGELRLYKFTARRPAFPQCWETALMIDFYFKLKRMIIFMVIRMDTQDWAIVAICLVLFGFFCMRGFGSRTKY